AAVRARWDGPIGLRLSPATVAGLAVPPGFELGVVILTGGAPAAPALAAFEGCGAPVLVEVVSSDEARAAVAAGAGGLVAKGAESGGRIGDTEAFILLQQVLRLDVPVWVQGGIGRHTAPAAVAAGA